MVGRRAGVRVRRPLTPRAALVLVALIAFAASAAGIGVRGSHGAQTTGRRAPLPAHRHQPGRGRRPRRERRDRPPRVPPLPRGGDPHAGRGPRRRPADRAARPAAAGGCLALPMALGGWVAAKLALAALAAALAAVTPVDGRAAPGRAAVARDRGRRACCRPRRRSRRTDRRSIRRCPPRSPVAVAHRGAHRPPRARRAVGARARGRGAAVAVGEVRRRWPRCSPPSGCGRCGGPGGPGPPASWPGPSWPRPSPTWRLTWPSTTGSRRTPTGSHFADGELTVVGDDPHYLGRSRRLVGLLRGPRLRAGGVAAGVAAAGAGARRARRPAPTRRGHARR